MTKKWNTLWVTVSVVLVFLVVLSSASVVATQVSNVTGEFSGSMVGYGDNANEDAGNFPHEIAVEGEITIEGENAVDPQVVVESGEFTTLDTSSASIFVEQGEADEFSTLHGADRVVLTADGVESETTLRVEFTVIFNGGTFGDITPGAVEVQYETLGGTEIEESFTVDDVTPNMEGIEEERDPSFGDLTLFYKILVVLGGIGIIAFLIWVVLNIRGNGKPSKPVN